MNDDTQQFGQVDGGTLLPPVDFDGDGDMHPVDTKSSQKNTWWGIAAVVAVLTIFGAFVVGSQLNTETTSASTDTKHTIDPNVLPVWSPTEPSQAPSSKAPETPVAEEPSSKPVVPVKPKESINPTPTANPCDITLLKGTMTQDEAEEYVSKCPVAGKKAAQALVNWFSTNTDVYASTPESSSDLEELKWELGPANYGHMRAGMDVFQYLYHNHGEIQQELNDAAPNNEAAIDQDFLDLWFQSSAWNAYPTEVKQPMFNALALRHYLALRAA
jgi:hypothetical protein